MPGTLIGGDLGAMGGGALGGKLVKGKYRGLGILLGTVLGAAGGGTIGTNINQEINDRALEHLIGAAAMNKRREAQQFNAVNYSQAQSIGSLAGDMTFFAPSLKIPGVGVRKAVSALNKQGGKALRNEGVRETVHDLADRSTEFAQGAFESYQQSEEQKRQGLPGLSAWQILGNGAVGALLSGETKFGKAMTEPYNRLKSPEFMLSNLNKLANKRAEVKADQVERRQTQMREQEGTITPTESRYRRFNLGGRLSGDVNAEGQPIIKGAEYAVYDPEKRRAWIHTDNDFVLEGYRSKNAADSLTSTEFIFKRTPLIEYTDKAAGVRRSILGISRDAGVVVKDIGPDGVSRISTVPLTEIRNEKIATRIANVMTEHGVKPNDKPAPFMPEAFDNFNKQVFDAEVTLDPSLPAFPARVVKQVNQKRQGMYIVALPDGTHMRVHESQINVDEAGAVIPRGQVQENELPRSLSDLIPPEKILKNQWKFGQGSENEAVLELTPEQLTVVGKIRRQFGSDLEAIKGIRNKEQRAAAIELNLGRIAKAAESIIDFEGPSKRYKRGDVIDVNTSQFGEQTAIVVGQNKYGHIVRLVDHPRIGSFTVQPSSIKGELSRREAESVLGETPSATQDEYTNPDFGEKFESTPVEPVDVKEETVGAPKLEPDHEKVDEIELSPYTKGKLAQQVSDFLDNSGIADDIRDGDFAEGEIEDVTPEIIDAEIVDEGIDTGPTALLGEKPKDVVDTGTDTGTDAGTDTGTDTEALAPGVVLHDTAHKVRTVLRDKPNIEGLNVDFVPIRYEARYSPARGEAVQEFVGKSKIINYNDRKVVLVYINGIQVPFYCSSGLGGKKDVPPGKWYPFFGIGAGSWFNKSSGPEITSYYGSPEFTKVAQYLDQNLGDVRSVPDLPKVGFTFNRKPASHVTQINEGLSPAENERPDTAENLRKNIDETLRRVREAVSKSKSPSASEYIDPDSIATDDVDSIAKLTKTNGQLDGFVDGKRPLGKHTQLQLPGFKSTGAYLNGKLFASMGNAQTYTSEIFNYSDRIITVVDINGAKIPFYCSTGHNPKDGVNPGQWYPFFGLGENWLNKGSSAAMSEYYGLPSLREVSESLDAKYGDVRKLAGYDAGVDPVDARLQNLVIPNYDGGSWGRRNAKNLVDFTNQSFDKVIDNVAEASANRNWLNERLAPLMSALKGEGVTDTGTGDVGNDTEETAVGTSRRKAIESLGPIGKRLDLDKIYYDEFNVRNIVTNAHKLGLAYTTNRYIVASKSLGFNNQVPVIKELLTKYLDGIGVDSEKRNELIDVATATYRDLYKGRPSLQSTINDGFFRPKEKIDTSNVDDAFMAKRPSFTGRAANRTKDGFIVTVKNTVLNVKINRDDAGDVRVRMEMTQYDAKKKNVTGQAVTEYTAKRQQGGEWHVFNTVYGDQRDASAFFTVKGSDRDFMRNLVRGMVNHSIGMKNSDPNWKSATDVSVEQSPEAQRKASDLSARKAEAEAKRAEVEANKEKQRQANKDKWQAELALRERLAEQANEIKREELRVKQKTTDTSAEITDLKSKLEKLQTDIGASAQQASDDLKSVKDQLTDVTDRLRKAKKKAKEAKNDAEKRQAEAIESALESQSKKHQADIAALQRIVDGVQNADKLATSQLEKKIEQLIEQVIKQQQELAGRSVQLSSDTTDNDARINALLAQMRMIESGYDTKIDELNTQIENLTKQLNNVGTSTETPKRVKKETVYKESEIESIVQNREIVTVLKEINGTQYKFDATIVNNRTQLKTVLREQYGYTQTGANYWSGIVDHFARAWAVRQLAARQRVRDIRPTERTTSEGTVELVMHRVLRQDEETVKSVAMLMREFYRDRFAAFAYVSDLSKLDDVGYGATFKAAREDGTSFNVIAAFASRDEETGVHEIAHALLRGMDKPYRDKLLAQMQRTRASAGVFSDAMPIDSEELFVGMFVASLRNQVTPVVQGNYESGDPRVQARDLDLFWNGTGKYLNEVFSTVTGKNIKNQNGDNLTQWVAPFDPNIRLFKGMQVYVSKDGEDNLAIVTKPDPKDKAAYDAYRTSYAPEGKVEVHIAGDQNPVLIDRGDISNLGGLTQGFNPGMLETLSKYLGAYYRESDANIWKSVKHLMEDFNDTLVPSTGTSDSIASSETDQGNQEGQQPDEQAQPNNYIATKETIKPEYEYDGNPIVVVSTQQQHELDALRELFDGTGIKVIDNGDLFPVGFSPTDVNLHLLTGIPYNKIPSKVFVWTSGYSDIRGLSGMRLRTALINQGVLSNAVSTNQYKWSSQLNALRDAARTNVINMMQNRDLSMRDMMINPMELGSTDRRDPYTVSEILSNISTMLNDGQLMHLLGVTTSGHDMLRTANLNSIGHDMLLGRIYARFGQDGLKHWADMVKMKPVIDEIFKYEPLTLANINRLFEYGNPSRRTPLAYALDKAAEYVANPRSTVDNGQMNPGTGFDSAVYLAMNSVDSDEAVKLLEKMQLSNDKRSRINPATWQAMAKGLQGFYRNDIDMEYMFNPKGGSVQIHLRDYARKIIDGTISNPGDFQRMNSRLELALSLDYMSREANGEYVPRYPYKEHEIRNYREAVSYELKEGLVDLFRHNQGATGKFSPVPITLQDGSVIFDRVKAQQTHPLGTLKVSVSSGDTLFKAAGTDQFLPYTAKAKQYNPDTVVLKPYMTQGHRLLPKRSWVTAMLLAELNNKQEIMRNSHIEEIALSGKLPKIVLSEADKKANLPINSTEVRTELKPIIQSMIKSGRIDGDIVRDSRGKPSNVYNLYRAATTMSDGAALLNYARTETKAFKKWSGNNPVVEAITTSDLRPNVAIGEIAPAVRANIRKYMSGKSIVKFAKSLNGTLTPEDAVELEVLMDDYLRGETTLAEIRQGIDAAIDDPNELQALIDTVSQQLASAKFDTARIHTADSDSYQDASTRPRTGRPLVTVGFAPNKTLSWLRSAGGFVMSGGPSDQTGYNQFGYYLRVDNPLVVDLSGQGMDAVSVENMFAKNPTRDGIVLLNAKHSIGGLNTTQNIILPRSNHAKLPWTTWTETKSVPTAYPSEFDYILRDKSQDEWMNEDVAFMGRMPDINYKPDYAGKAEPAATSGPRAETPIRVRKTRVPDTADKLTSIVDFINDVTRLTLSSDLAFMTLQAGIISLSNPAIGFKAFLMAMRGFAPNLRVEWFGGIGHRKLGREVYHDIGDAMRQNPAYELAREAGLPLGMFEIDERFADALSIELHNLRRINPDATLDDCRTTLMDIDELGTNDEWFIKNRLSRHLPGQGQFERFNAILHDQILLLAFDNWHKQFLAMGYVEGSEKMKRALKDGARILAVTTGDVAYSTNKQRDATAGRIAKLLFTAPRWVMSRALIDPWVNSVLSGDSFSLLHDLMGHDNPVWNLYKGDQAAASLGRTMYGRLVGGQIFMMILAILWQNFNPETEVETDVTRQAGRIRIGDFRIDPPAGLFDHYRLGYRLMEAALQTGPSDAKKAKKSDGTIIEKIASDLGREVSYKASPMLNMAVGIFQTGKTPIGEPMFGQNEAATHVYNQLVLPRLIEMNGGIQPWMTDVRVSNAFIERFPTAVTQFIDSYYAADKYGANPAVYSGLNTGLNFIGLKTEIKPVKALKERKRKNYESNSAEAPSAKSVIEQQGLIGLFRGQD
jgi:hypothetical protein